MCDYSLTHAKSRPAAVGDKLMVHDFGHTTRGFKDVSDGGEAGAATAVCLLPGTEVVFADEVQATGVFDRIMRWIASETKPPVATFRQINLDRPYAHHDALEFPDGKVQLLTSLVEGQRAIVLQLPAEAQPVPAPQEKAKQGLEFIV